MTAAPTYDLQDTRPRLDRLMSAMRAHDPAPWGWRPVLLPCGALVALILIANLITHGITPHNFTEALTATILINVGIYGAVVTVVYFSGRDLARRYNGWGWTFGLQWPRWMDGAWVAAGVGMVILGRVAVVLVANALTDNRAGEQAQNISVNATSGAVYIVLAVIVVLIAPPVEELVFRGLLLRTFMRAWGFWAAALLSSAIFALFHVYQVDTLAGATTLAGVVFTLGLTNSLLVRWSGRITAGIIVHALFNGLAVLVLYLQNT